jgi:hypothetical protein
MTLSIPTRLCAFVGRRWHAVNAQLTPSENLGLERQPLRGAVGVLDAGRCGRHSLSTLRQSQPCPRSRQNHPRTKTPRPMQRSDLSPAERPVCWFAFGFATR